MQQFDILPVVRGVQRSTADLFRWEIIERLMCDLHVDLKKMISQYKQDPSLLGEFLKKLRSFEEDGLVIIRNNEITVTEEGRPFLRNIAVVFDAYYRAAPHRHAQAI